VPTTPKSRRKNLRKIHGKTCAKIGGTYVAPVILENETHLTAEQAEFAIAHEASMFTEQEIAEANAWFDAQRQAYIAHLDYVDDCVKI